MLVSSFIDLHIEGGMVYMLPMSLMLLANICIFIYTLVAAVQKKEINSKWLEAIKQIGGLAAAWGTLSTIIGLFYAFDALEASKDIIPFQVIMGGLKVALITVLWGLIIFCLSLLAYIILKLTARNSQA